MQKVHPYFSGSYCSQLASSCPSPRSVEEGVEIVRLILAKEILCRHDVCHINRVYAATDLLEKREEETRGEGSLHILKAIVEKVKKMVEGPIHAKDLISLYHLQKFSDPGLGIRALFARVCGSSKRDVQMAALLPFCFSEKKFDKDVKFLMDLNPGVEVEKILNQKRERFRDIERRKRELAELPQGSYPAYFSELLEKGYVHLYDHLVQMRALPDRTARASEAYKIKCSLQSSIILEARDAILRKIESSIPKESKNVLFLVGNAGVGKSTTLCFLRGDKMVSRNLRYESQNDKGDLVGHEGAVSCTLLPTVEKIGEWFVVDFPGFNDTNGPLISTSIELALKTAIQLYASRIVVLDAITNKEGRFAAASELAARLDRLLDNKESCIPGITKYYSNDGRLREIKTIEAQQKAERSSPSDEEKELCAEIKMMRKYNAPEVDVQQKEQKLVALQFEREQKAKEPLPETERKKELKNSIQKDEDDLLGQSGLNKEYLLRLDDLEDPECLSSLLQILAQLVQEEGRCIYARKPWNFGGELKEAAFKKSLLEEVESQDYRSDAFEDAEAFKESVLNDGLIKTLFARSNPEIGQLLYLMDPAVAQGYDKEMVMSCIKKFMENIIVDFDISLISKVLSEMGEQASEQKVIDLNRKLDQLKGYIEGLLGLPKQDPVKTEAEWKRIRSEYQKARNNVRENYEVSTWAKVCFHLPAGMQNFIYNFSQWKNEQKVADEVIDQFCTSLDQMYKALLTLKEVERILQKRHDLEQAFNVVPLSLESIDQLNHSIEAKINKVRSVYGEAEWDARVKLLAQEFLPTRFDPKDSSHAPLIAMQVYLLIESNPKWDRLYYLLPPDFCKKYDKALMFALGINLAAMFGGFLVLSASAYIPKYNKAFTAAQAAIGGVGELSFVGGWFASFGLSVFVLGCQFVDAGAHIAASVGLLNSTHLLKHGESLDLMYNTGLLNENNVAKRKKEALKGSLPNFADVSIKNSQASISLFNRALYAAALLKAYELQKSS